MHLHVAWRKVESSDPRGDRLHSSFSGPVRAGQLQWMCVGSNPPIAACKALSWHVRLSWWVSYGLLNVVE